jgi:hypothetical protein
MPFPTIVLTQFVVEPPSRESSRVAARHETSLSICMVPESAPNAMPNRLI